MRTHRMTLLVVFAGLACGGSDPKPPIDAGAAGADGGAGTGGTGGGFGGTGGNAGGGMAGMAGGMAGMGGGMAGMGGAAPSMFMPMGGSRLKIRWVDGPDGQRSFEGWYDTQLKVNCFFLRASDGELRCLPNGYILEATLGEWADSACSTPVVPNVRTTCAAEQHTYVRRRDVSNACETRERVYKLGDKIAENRTWLRATDGTCVAAMVYPGIAAHRVGEEVPPAMFARGTLTPEAPRQDTPIQLVVLETEDGGRVDFGWRNSAAGADCSLFVLSDGQLHCVPKLATLSTVAHVDTACSQAAAFYTPACGPAATWVRQNIPGTCPIASNIFGLGPELTMVYRRNGAMCEAAAPVQGNKYHALGDMAGPERFAAFQQVNDQGPQRVRRRRLVAPGGRSIGGAWWDGERQDICFRGLTAGKSRCVPASARMGFHFADAGCTQWLLRVPRDSCPPKTAVRFDSTTCPTSDVHYNVGALHTGQVWELGYVRSDTTANLECRPYNPSPVDVFHAVTPIPGDSFQEMTLTEPPQ